MGRLRAVTLPLRPFRPDELVAAHTAVDVAFLSDPDPTARDHELRLLDPECTLGAHDGDQVVATAAWHTLALSLPGTTATVAGVTWVSVASTHRRQGLLRALMTQQLADVRGRGVAVAALWASEPGIYGRFGYGPASWQVGAAIARGTTFTRPVDTTGLRVMVSPTADDLRPAYDTALSHRPGWFARSPEWWAYRLMDHEGVRGGQTSLRAVLDGERGYALYRTKAEWGPGGAGGSVTVGEVVATDPQTEARLWRFLLDLDLVVTVKAWALPVDSPLLHLVTDVRRLQARLGDGLWVRLVSVAEALPLRRYATDLDVVLDVTDEVCPWNAGRWRLTSVGDDVRCTSTSDDADVALDVRELGAAFLGGTSLADRATAGFVREVTPGALARTSVAFGWSGRAPHCPLVF